MQTTENTFRLKVERDVAGKTLDFKDIESLTKWKDDELAQFDWLTKVQKAPANQVRSHVQRYFKSLADIIQNINANLNRGMPIEGHITAAGDWFSNTYKNGNLILSGSSEAKFVNKLRDDDPLKAAVALGHFINVPALFSNGIESPKMLEGSYEYFQYLNGLNAQTMAAEKDALVKLKEEWDEHLVEFTQKEATLAATFEATKTNFDSFFNSKKEEFSQFVKANGEDLAELKKTYDQYMSLKAPVDYWIKKRTHHKELAKLFKNWALGVGVAGGLALAGSIFLLFTHESSSVPYWKIALVILVGTLFFWAMRILIKLMLSNIHLESDAHEREIMSLTYLSLLRENSGLEDSDKKLILATLFRPSSSGLIGDDGIPPGVYDLITKVISK
ncbi:MAG: DUF6161 domain-containing protein [Oligoflexia bacterium]|nr:DUF6161 domain-containing protein [Oligoflexia bacterium]